MLTELLQKIVQILHTETPRDGAAAPSVVTTGGTTVQQKPSANIIDILPDAIYKLPDSDEPIDGLTLKNQRLMQKDYTKKTTNFSEERKTYQQQLAQREQEIEKLNNQLLSLQLGNKFQQTQAPLVTNSQPTQTQTSGNYDWLYDNQNAVSEPNAQTQTNSGINSTPMNNLNLEQLAELLSSHPKFKQPVQEKIVTDIQTLFSQERERNRQQTEELERNLQIESEYKKQYGQRGVDLLYAMEAAKNEGNVSRWFELQAEEKKLIAQKAVAEAKEADKRAQVEAVEAAMSGPVVIEPKEGENPRDAKRRRKQETIKRAQAVYGPLHR